MPQELLAAMIGSALVAAVAVGIPFAIALRRSRRLVSDGLTGIRREFDGRLRDLEGSVQGLGAWPDSRVTLKEPRQAAPPHPNPPPQGGRGPENSSPVGRRGRTGGGGWMPENPLPPCGGGLGRGVAGIEALNPEAPRPRQFEPSRREDGRTTSSAARPSPPTPHVAPTPQAGPTLIAIPGLPPAPASDPHGAETLARRYAWIWELVDAGESEEAIARKAGLPIGQVEVILGLRRQALRPTSTGPRP